MATHDFSTPIPPGTLRISVIADGNVYVTDLSSAKLSETFRVFAEFAGMGAEAAIYEVVTADTCEVGDAYLIGFVALRLFLHMSNAKQVMNRDRLRGIVVVGGRAMLTVSAETAKGEWDFRLYEVPSRPASVRLSRVTQRNRRRGR